MQLGLLKAEVAKHSGRLVDVVATDSEPALLRETEVFEVLGSSARQGGVCTQNTFVGYGALGVAAAATGEEKAAQTILNGDGIPHGQQGLVQKSANWWDRLARRCEEVVGEVGEERLYEEYRRLSPKDMGLKSSPQDEDQHAGLFQPLCKQLTDSCKSAPPKQTASTAAAKGKLNQKKKKKKKKNKKNKKKSRQGGAADKQELRRK